ncbi:MAG TPA: hypothetical protein VHV99_18370 [Paraburkholderia sp.]|nr:hypothetical protein [Paraburkholderia sp.]
MAGWLRHSFPRVSRYGEIGVDVFFVIFGFVMAWVTHGVPRGLASARSFIATRIARVSPLYRISRRFSLRRDDGWEAVRLLTMRRIRQLTVLNNALPGATVCLSDNKPGAA